MDSKLTSAIRLAELIEDMVAADRVLRQKNISINPTTDGKLSIVFAKQPASYLVKRLNRLVAQAEKRLDPDKSVAGSELVEQSKMGQVTLLVSQSEPNPTG